MSAVVLFEPPAQMLTMNQRLHWAKKAEVSRAWRTVTHFAAYADLHRRLPLPPCVVTVHLPVKGNRRRDPHNWFPTVKPIVDGLVDAGVWPDDSQEWVRCMEPVLVVGGELVRVELVPS